MRPAERGRQGPPQVAPRASLLPVHTTPFHPHFPSQLEMLVRKWREAAFPILFIEAHAPRAGLQAARAHPHCVGALWPRAVASPATALGARLDGHRADVGIGLGGRRHLAGGSRGGRRGRRGAPRRAPRGRSAVVGLCTRGRARSDRRAACARTTPPRGPPQRAKRPQRVAARGRGGAATPTRGATRPWEGSSPRAPTPARPAWRAARATAGHPASARPRGRRPRRHPAGGARPTRRPTRSVRRPARAAWRRRKGTGPPPSPAQQATTARWCRKRCH